MKTSGAKGVFPICSQRNAYSTVDKPFPPKRPVGSFAFVRKKFHRPSDFAFAYNRKNIDNLDGNLKKSNGAKCYQIIIR